MAAQDSAMVLTTDTSFCQPFSFCQPSSSFASPSGVKRGLENLCIFVFRFCGDEQKGTHTLIHMQKKGQTFFNFWNIKIMQKVCD